MYTMATTVDNVTENRIEPFVGNNEFIDSVCSLSQGDNVEVMYEKNGGIEESSGSIVKIEDDRDDLDSYDVWFDAGGDTNGYIHVNVNNGMYYFSDETYEEIGRLVTSVTVE